MSIFIHKDSRVVVQGVAGKEGAFWAKHMKDMGTQVVFGVTPGKEGQDVDGITDGSMAGVFTNMPIGYPPCTAQACLEILKHYNVPLSGKRAVVVGRSLVVGKPAAMMLMGKNATVTVCHTKTVNTAEICKNADIIVSAAGVLNSLTKDYVRPGQVVIDVSINWDANKPNAKGGLGGIAGDACFSEVEPIVDEINPVPGGVGTVTSSVLLAHTVRAAELLHSAP